MGTIRSNFAGSWYPSNSKDCESAINGFLKDTIIKTPKKMEILGGIVPHAGWFFSGSIACNVIKYLKENSSIDTIVIFGMHLGTNSPGFIMKEGEWDTPFGPLTINKKLASAIIEKFDNLEVSSKYFARDNTIELQLPFIKYFFNDVSIVPIGAPPDITGLQLGNLIPSIAKDLGNNIKILGSTDLTHYGYNYGFSPKGSGKIAYDWVRNDNDKEIIDTMMEMNAEKVIEKALKDQNACCSGAAAAAIASLKSMGANKTEQIAYATSYDKSPGDSFVGYVGLVFGKE
ncbi:MAG: AmmeMemoRadiSam system protein B [Desulfobacterales bacterium]|nr:AmmeMemoRadiSam system protein B [Desulfobacterales bacterium]